MGSTRRISTTLAAAGLLALGAAAPAVASSYYSASSPLTAWQDGVAQAQMYGSYSIANLSYARNSTNQRDPRPGGDYVYEETFYNWYDGSGAFVTDVGTDTSAKTNTSSWYSQADQHPLQGCCVMVRMYTNVCEDHGIWQKDPCSSRPTQRFEY